MQQREQRIEGEPVPVGAAVETTTTPGHRDGWLATVFSAVAVVASVFSIYLSTLQAPDLEVYLPPAFQYAMDAEDENFTVPITIANSGARSGTVVSMELEVHNDSTNTTRRFYSAYLGEHPLTQPEENRIVRQFAPMAVLGHAVRTETVRFYPASLVREGAEQPPRIVSDAGEYSFRLKVNTAAPSDPSLLDRLQGRAQPAPVTAQMVLPVLDHRRVMQMRSKDWLAERL